MVLSVANLLPGMCAAAGTHCVGYSGLTDLLLLIFGIILFTVTDQEWITNVKLQIKLITNQH